MNFLAHLYLSGDSEGLRIGNFIADSVKGHDYEQYSAEIRQGILLHRKIDTFTDTHPIVEESKKRLRSTYHKYAGVIVDVYYDHFLAANWNDYSPVPLRDYAQEIYTLVERHRPALPFNSQRFSEYMVRYNILEAYARLEGIDRVLKGMASRATFTSNMESAIRDLEQHYGLFGDEFRNFFPELQQFVNAHINIS